MWNTFLSSIIACSTSLAQSKEGRMECKLRCPIQDVPLLGILLSQMLGFCRHFWQNNHWKRFNVVVTYLNKNIIITKKAYKERSDKLLLGHKNELINIYRTMNCFTQFIGIVRIIAMCAIALPWKGDQPSHRRFLFPPPFAWNLKCTYVPRLTVISARRRYEPYWNDVRYELFTIKKFMSIVFIQRFWQCWHTWWRRTKAKVSGKNLETLLTMGMTVTLNLIAPRSNS